jgi:hypothetical protein
MAAETALIRSDDPDQIDQCAGFLAKSKIRHMVFKSIYKGQRKERSVELIMNGTGLNEKQVRKALTELADHHMAVVNGRGKETKIEKEPFCRKYRNQIIRASENPSYRAKLEVKKRSSSRTSPGAGIYPKIITRSQSINRSKSRNNRNLKLKLACISTNPYLDLKTDMEARVIQKALKSSKNRDFIEVQHLSAATFEDLIESFNEFSPDIVHFSGHGNDGSIIFDTESYDEEGFEVDFRMLRKAIESTDTPPKLVVLNSCFSGIGGGELIGASQALVAMKDELDDTAAAIFSKQFYSAIFAGQSLSSAVLQAKLLLEAGQYPDAELPEIKTIKSVDPKKLILMK